MPLECTTTVGNYGPGVNPGSVCLLFSSAVSAINSGETTACATAIHHPRSFFSVPGGRHRIHDETYVQPAPLAHRVVVARQCRPQRARQALGHRRVMTDQHGLLGCRLGVRRATDRDSLPMNSRANRLKNARMKPSAAPAVRPQP